jgi:hypothetical protein
MTFNPLVAGSIPARPTKKQKGSSLLAKTPVFLNLTKPPQIRQKRETKARQVRRRKYNIFFKILNPLIVQRLRQP